MASFDLILLAAGASRRFSSAQPGAKLLTDWHGKPLYQHGLDTLQAVSRTRKNCRILVITRYAEIEQVCTRRGIPWVPNHRAEEGISTSLHLGLNHAQGDYAVFFTADQPNLRAETVAAFLHSLEDSGASLGAVSRDGEPGNPCAFARKWFPELYNVTGDRGGKAVLRRHLPEALLYEAGDPAELIDFDRPEDFA